MAPLQCAASPLAPCQFWRDNRGMQHDSRVDVTAPEIPADLAAKRDRLLDLLRSFGSCAVAYSGGLDSTVLAKAAQLALGERAVAVTGASASLATAELDECRSLAALIGIRHEVLQTEELADPNYRRNESDRCYHCKNELFTQVDRIAQRFGAVAV